MSISEVALKSFSSYQSSAYEPNWTVFEANLPEGYLKDRTLYTPLQVAVICQDVARCRTLLEEGANPNEKGSIDVAPLETALEDLNNEEIGILLVEKGAEMPQIILNFARLGVKGLVPLWFSLFLENKGRHFIKSCVENGKIDPNLSIQGANFLVWGSLLSENCNGPKELLDLKKLLTCFIQKGASFFPCVTDSSFIKNIIRPSVDDADFKSFNILHFSKGKMFEFFYKLANDEHKCQKGFDGENIIHRVAQTRDEQAMQVILKEDSSKPHLFRQTTKKGSTPLMEAKMMNNRHYWSLHTFNQLETVDGGYTKWVKNYRKLRNIIEYPVPPKGDILTYYCDPDPNGKIQEEKNRYYNWVAHTFSLYSSKSYCTLKDSRIIFETFESINDKTPEIAIKRFVKDKKPVLIPTGWSEDKDISGHFTSVLFYKNLCVKVSTCTLVQNTSRQELSSPTDQSLPQVTPPLVPERLEPDFSGIKFYRIGEDVSESAILESMRKLYNHCNIEGREAEKYFYQTINQELKLKGLFEATAYQTLGNCPYLAAKYSLFASLILSQAQNDFTSQVLYDAFDMGEYHFINWEHDSWKEIVTLLNTTVRSPFASPILKEELYTHFIKKHIKGNFSDTILQLIFKDRSVVNWQDKETGKSLIRVLYENGSLNEHAFKLLVLYRPDLELKDLNGKTFADDLIATPPPEWMAIALQDLDKYEQDIRRSHKSVRKENI